MQVRVEFTTEPFHGEDDQLPAHVTAAADVLRYAGLSPDLGPLGTSVVGDAEVVVDAVARALKEALAHGATRVTLTLGDVGAAALPASADIVATATDLTDGLSRLIADVERELGGALAGLPRAEKQHAVRLLEERGAFEMRRSAETVAEALGLTRFTVYNYLNRIRDQAAEPAG
ncbi:helix-turn-helix domain-containing protein [Pedococcus bigeumensis]|uniref:DNA-binding protein n=1 Tax=Pedococcus bigeumensis TaxID=433644 RepID=A0A502CQF2_9MICO|nr:helix-turn-helix domain-containing protein [Pedococcus bigeumensis]TPG14972.1 DNA-binding protein [Pedococcus bigeumensis]